MQDNHESRKVRHELRTIWQQVKSLTWSKEDWLDLYDTLNNLKRRIITRHAEEARKNPKVDKGVLEKVINFKEQDKDD